MQTRAELVDRSLAILRRGQARTGAFVACPSFRVYRYSWFRDGAFIAQALDAWKQHEEAERFYAWGVDVILRNAHSAEEALKTPIGSVPATCLHTRYTAEGRPADEEWPNFQLDGFGTFLWGLTEHLRLAGNKPMPEQWVEASELLVRYLTHLWQSPNNDCWEEFPDRIHISTLCAIAGGLSALASYHPDQALTETVGQIRDFILRSAEPDGFLPKFVGTRAVDAALLWACVPFRVLEADHPVMARTVESIEADLRGPHGGVHRYADDSYYGGGEWILLTALLGEYYLARGEGGAASEILSWIERQASPAGELPEQVPFDLNVPEMYDVWVQRWGPIASPLLWSHAAYLRLKHALSRAT